MSFKLKYTILDEGSGGDIGQTGFFVQEKNAAALNNTTNIFLKVNINLFFKVY
jgi:hypothetical protein